MYRMDLKDGKYPERWQIHAIEKSGQGSQTGHSVKYSPACLPSSARIAGRNFFLIYADDDGKSYVS